MKDTAAANQLITLRCYLCHRRVTYLASDLVEIVGHDWPLHIPPFACYKDGREYMQVEVWNPNAEDLGRVPVRRPGRVIQTWKTVMLGD